MGNHYCAAVPPEGALQESGELAVPVVDIVGPSGSPEGIDAVAQGQEGAVDVGPLDHTLTSVL